MSATQFSERFLNIMLQSMTSLGTFDGSSIKIAYKPKPYTLNLKP